MKKILLGITFLMFITALNGYAQIVNTVTFKADVSELLAQGFEPGVNTIRVEGLNWDNSEIAVSGDRDMSPDPNNANIYSTVLTITSGNSGAIGDTARWKFKGGPDGDFVNGGWESGDLNGYDGRAFVFQANGSNIDMEPITPRLEMIQLDNALQNTVTFQADLTTILGSGEGYFDPSRGDIIEVKGFWGNAADTNIVDGILVSGDPIMVSDPFNPAIYSATLTIAIPSGGIPGMGTGFKFKASPDDHFSNTGWEVTPNRNYIFGENNSDVTLDPIQPAISPAAGPLENPLNVLYQINLADGAANRYDNSLIPRDQVEFVILKGAAQALGNWQGSWTVQDTAQAVILNDDGENGDKVAGDNIWSVLVTFEAGEQQGLSPYKFGVYYPGCENITGASGAPLDNSAPSGADFSFNIHESIETVEVLNTWPTILTGIKEIKGEIPSDYSISQNYPNPFNPETKIRYTLKEAGFTKINVYNSLGEHVANLVNMEQNAAAYEVSFSPVNLPSGIYFYTILSNNFSSTKKMIYLK